MQLLILCLLDLDLRTSRRRARRVEIMESSVLESSFTSESAKALGIHSTFDVNSTWSAASLSSACVGDCVVKPAITPSTSKGMDKVSEGTKMPKIESGACCLCRLSTCTSLSRNWFGERREKVIDSLKKSASLMIKTNVALEIGQSYAVATVAIGIAFD